VAPGKGDPPRPTNVEIKEEHVNETLGTLQHLYAL